MHRAHELGCRLIPGFMPRFSQFFASQKRLWQQQRELEQLRKEIVTLRAQNQSMKEGMRRCISCDYRIDYKDRQGQAPIGNSNNDCNRENEKCP